MKTTNLCVRLLLGAALSCPLLGQTTFTFENNESAAGSYFHQKASGSVTSDGITLTASAFAEGEGEVFWSNAADFGVNASGGEDTPDEFDTGEGMLFSFNQDVYLTGISVASFGNGSDSGTVSFDGGSTIASITATGLTSLGNTFVSNGTTLRFEALAGSFTLESISISAVPEPSTYASLAGVAMLGFAAYRRHRGRQARPPADRSS